MKLFCGVSALVAVVYLFSAFFIAALNPESEESGRSHVSIWGQRGRIRAEAADWSWCFGVWC